MSTPDTRPGAACAGCGPAVGRRGALLGAAGAVLLAACGGAADEPAGAGPASRAPSGGPSAGSSAGSSSGGGALASLADLTEGSALSAAAADGTPVLLVRTGPATVTGFSAVCPHEGCTVTPAGDELSCPCHGSTFDLAGARTGGPAERGLTPFPVTVSGDSVLPA